MTKTQINFRASTHTAGQLERLTITTGMTQTEVISVAIDRMFREEINLKKQAADPGNYPTEREG